MPSFSALRASSTPSARPFATEASRPQKVRLPKLLSSQLPEVKKGGPHHHHPQFPSSAAAAPHWPPHCFVRMQLSRHWRWRCSALSSFSSSSPPATTTSRRGVRHCNFKLKAQAQGSSRCSQISGFHGYDGVIRSRLKAQARGSRVKAQAEAQGSSNLEISDCPHNVDYEELPDAAEAFVAGAVSHGCILASPNGVDHHGPPRWTNVP